MENDRRGFLGGSNAAAVLGYSNWATPLNVYFQATGEQDPDPPKPDPDRDKRLKRGKRMEPVIRQMLEDEYPIKITKFSTDEAPNRYVDDELPFLRAEIDFEWEVTKEMLECLPESLRWLPLGSIQNGEIKTVHQNVAAYWGEEATDEIPVVYAYQAMHGLGVTKRHGCLVVSLFGADDLVLYGIERDDALIKSMRAKLSDFWHNHVEKRIPPPPINQADAYKLLRMKRDSVIEADHEVVALVKKLKDTRGHIKDLEGLDDELSFQICCRVLGTEVVERKSELTEAKHTIMYAGKKLVSVNLESRKSLNADLLWAKNPELAAECTRTSKFFIMRLPRKMP